MEFLSTIISGISMGGIYALIALGYTMVYGIAKMLNFAHGDVIMVGAFAMFITLTEIGLPPILCIIIGTVICTILGVAIEKIAYKPLRQATSLAVLITAIGVSYFLQNSAQLIFGADSKQFKPLFGNGSISLFDGGIIISHNTIITISISLIIMIGLTLFINKTKTGRAMLAVSEDKGAAQLMGINVNKTISITFAIGSALAAIAGALLCSTYTKLSPTIGAMPGIRAFTAAVFGGIGSIPGAMIGGILLGVIEKLSQTYISTQLSDAIVFGILIIILLVKPTGILGKKTNEKV